MSRFSRPENGEVHLHSAHFIHDFSQIIHSARYLSDEEATRADRFKCEESMRHFRVARLFLRTILSGYLDCTPEKVPISISIHGKPFLAGDDHHLRFNMAHSGDRLLLAVSQSHDVGIDLETIATGRPFKQMARLVFSPREQHELNAVNSAELPPLFSRYWVRREACLKAAGSGFSLPRSTTFDVCGTTHAPHRFSINQNGFQFTVADIDAPDGFCAAIAVTGHHSASLREPVWMTNKLTD